MLCNLSAVSYSHTPVTKENKKMPNVMKLHELDNQFLSFSCDHNPKYEIGNKIVRKQIVGVPISKYNCKRNW